MPGLAPPKGVMSNFDSPPSRADSMRIVSSISMAIMIVFVALRVYSRLCVTRAFGKDDCGHPSCEMYYRSLLTI